MDRTKYDPSKAHVFPMVVQDMPYSVIKLPSIVSLHRDPQVKHVPLNKWYTIAMIDVSGSIKPSWKSLQDNWMEFIYPYIRGRVDVYGFASEVKLLRSTPHLFYQDHEGGDTNVTAALREISEKIDGGKAKYVRVILITDGIHNSSNDDTLTVVQELPLPEIHKIVEVYVLGIGLSFPLHISEYLRRLIHTGCDKIPKLFWSQMGTNLRDEMAFIRDEMIKDRKSIFLTPPGLGLPLRPQIFTEYNVSDWVIFEIAQSELRSLEITNEDGTPIEQVFHDYLPINALSSGLLVHWHKVLLRCIWSSGEFKSSVFDFIAEVIRTAVQNIHIDDDSSRAPHHSKSHFKYIKGLQLKNSGILKRSKRFNNVIEDYRRQIKSSEMLLKSVTCVGKYKEKIIELKGYSKDFYWRDMSVFVDKYDYVKTNFHLIEYPSTDDCCRVTSCSTLTSILSPDFPEMFNKDKYEFLKDFTMSGIPVLINFTQSTDLNPWVIHISSILVNPYAILSQQTLEYDGTKTREEDWSLAMQTENKKTRFNAIIPVFPTNTVRFIKPLLQTKIYSMCCTYAILKNVHIIDYQCHLAALGCVWLETIHKFPVHLRPEYIRTRIDMIYETTKIYCWRNGVRSYIQTLLDSPPFALITEYLDYNIKCQSMLKPLFLLYVGRRTFNNQIENRKYDILKHVIVEFVGRCYPLPKYMPFSHTFLRKVEKETEVIRDHIKENINQFFKKNYHSLLDNYYTPEELVNDAKQRVKQVIKDYKIVGIKYLKIRTLNVKDFKNPITCGDVSWEKIKSWANEMNFTECQREELFSNKMIRMCLYHAVKYKTSRARMTNNLPNIDQIDILIREEITKEIRYRMRKELLNSIPLTLKERWLTNYSEIHDGFILPMLKSDIIHSASKRGIKVNEDNFNKIFKYRPYEGLVSNACMCIDCPHYLMPNNYLHEHLKLERRDTFYIHNLHKLISINYDKPRMELMQLMIHEFNKKGLQPTNDRLQQMCLLEKIDFLKEHYRMFHEKNY